MKKIFTPLRNMKSIALLTSLLFASTILQAQVVYTDVNPDVTKTQTTDGTSTYDIDLNNDSQVDFVVSISKATDQPTEDETGTISSTVVYISQYDNTNIVGIAVDNLDDENAIGFSNGASITSGETWDDQFAILSYVGTITMGGPSFPVSGGNFISSTGKYIGVQIEVSGETYYGYIALNTTSNSFTVTGYAYEQTADVSIAAGATSTTAVSSYLKANTTIYTVDNSIVADFKNTFTGQLDVVNMNGVIVKSVSVNGSSVSVSMEGMPTGVYQVMVSGSEGIASDKVVIANK